MVNNIGARSSFSPSRIQQYDQESLDHLTTSQIDAKFENTNITHVLSILDQLFSELQSQLTKFQKNDLKELKSKVRKNGDDSKFQYDKKAALNLLSAAMSSCLSLASTPLFPGRDETLLKTVHEILPKLESSMQTWIDGILSKQNNETGINTKEMEGLQQGLQSISNAMNTINQAIQSGSDGERRALSR